MTTTTDDANAQPISDGDLAAEPPPAATDSGNTTQRDYTRDIEESNISLMLHNPRLFSELSGYFKPELFSHKPASQLWKLISKSAKIK
jgi:hypothetical protein